MHKMTHSFSFLMEFLFVIFFFSLSAMICIQIYSNSYVTNQRANQTKEALEFAQNYIETNETIQEGTYTFDEQFEENQNSYYIMTIEYSNESYPHYVLSIEQDGNVLVSIPFYKGDRS